MKFNVDDETLDRWTAQILVQQYRDMQETMESPMQSLLQEEDKRAYTKVTAALEVLIAWHCTHDECKELGVEYFL